jgi:hypothetical protein
MTYWPSSRFLFGVVCVAAGLVVGAASASAQSAGASPAPTFHKDIEPILQRSCQRCHNPNSVAPMSLITYEQVRPYARAIKQRTALANAPWSRGAMPPWFLEKTIGIQKIKDDVSLSPEEIELVGQWADAGAPRGNPAEAPPPLNLAEAGEWTLGKPDLIVSSPTIYVEAVASDWGGNLGKSPLGLTVDRYAATSEFMEVREVIGERSGPATIGGLFVFHHANVGVAAADALVGGEAVEEVDESTVGPSRLPIHEVGRNADVFPSGAGKMLPAGGFITWDSMHVHPTGTPGSEGYARLDIGFKLHPIGYRPTRDIRGYSFGRTQLQVDPLATGNRQDAYFVAPQAMKLVNYEPHMHANGVRMCLQAIYGRAVETLNCSGYDHNWVRNFYYEENYEPLIPKGTILHAIAWFDNSAANENVIDPRNAASFGNSSVNNMFIVFNLAEFLTDEEYLEEVRKRKEFLRLTGEEQIGCPACYLPEPRQPATRPGAPRNQTDNQSAPPTATSGTN